MDGCNRGRIFDSNSGGGLPCACTHGCDCRTQAPLLLCIPAAVCPQLFQPAGNVTVRVFCCNAWNRSIGRRSSSMQEGAAGQASFTEQQVQGNQVRGHNFKHEETLPHFICHPGGDGAQRSIPCIVLPCRCSPEDARRCMKVPGEQRTSTCGGWCAFASRNQNPVLVGSGLSIKPDRSGSRLDTMDLYRPRNRSISSTYDSCSARCSGVLRRRSKNSRHLRTTLASPDVGVGLSITWTSTDTVPAHFPISQPISHPLSRPNPSPSSKPSALPFLHVYATIRPRQRTSTSRVGAQICVVVAFGHAHAPHAVFSSFRHVHLLQFDARVDEVERIARSHHGTCAQAHACRTLAPTLHAIVRTVVDVVVWWLRVCVARVDRNHSFHPRWQPSTSCCLGGCLACRETKPSCTTSQAMERNARTAMQVKGTWNTTSRQARAFIHVMQGHCYF